MKHAKTLAILCIAATLLCLLAGCGQPSTPISAEVPVTVDEPIVEEPLPVSESITVTDMKGREITLEKPAERIVALTAADCEILFAIGAGDKLIGRGEYCDYPSEVLDIPTVQSGYETNVEQIIALQPDVLFLGDMNQPEEQIEQLEAAGIRVVVSDADSIEGVYTAITMIAHLMGEDENAAALIGDMQSTLEELRAKATGDGSGSIYFEVSPLQWGLWTAGTNTFMDEVTSLLGMKNCFSDVDGWGEISEEQVIERNPDYIVSIGVYSGDGPTPTEEILSRPGWENIAAVQNGKILNLQNNELSRPGPRLADGAKLLFALLYGEASN